MWLYGIHVANVTGLEKVMTFAKWKYIGIFRTVKRYVIAENSMKNT